MSDHNIPSQQPSDSIDHIVLNSLLPVFGRLISLFVHETNNHLATLRESSGLGDDIINAPKLADKDKLKELEKLLAAMDDRIGHAASLVRAFGELGRGMENPAAPLMVNNAIENILPFLSKIARQKNLVIRTAFDRKLPAAAGDFFCFQCLILALFDNYCTSLEPHAAATISTDKTDSAVIVSFNADKHAGADSEKLSWQRETLESIASIGGFRIDQKDQGRTISITVKKKE
jgi:C4-dicarboxylate-specific signal transduction histidine kinase